MIKVAQADVIVDIGSHWYHGLFLRNQLRGRFLGQEVATHLGIGVEHAREVRIRAIVTQGEGHRTVAVETDLVARAQDGHLFQVISCRAVELLADAVAARAVNMDLARIGEAHLAKLAIGDLIDAIIGNRNLHPLARSELGPGGIDRCIERTRLADAHDGQHNEACDLKYE